MKIIYSAGFALLTVFLGFHCLFSQSESSAVQPEIIRMEVYSIPWDVLTNSPLTVEEVIGYTTLMGIKLDIRSKRYFRPIVNSLNQTLKPYEGRTEFPMDARTVVLLVDEHENADTVSFNNFEIFQYNSDYYLLDSMLLENLMNILPQDHVLTMRKLEKYWKD